MDATERFSSLLARSDPPLDEAALCIAAHAYPDLDVDDWLHRVDDLAAEVPGTDLDALLAHVFDTRGFAGNTVDYDDPRNSFLNDVISRRLGIPISLSVLVMELGRRMGVRLVGVGMPGHFLVREHDPRAPTPYVDAFAGGERLSAERCRALFTSSHGATVPWRAAYIEPIGPVPILARILANLERSYTHRAPGSAAWVLRLALRVPRPPRDRRALATRLGGLGAFAEAASELEALAPLLPDDEARAAEREVVALRSRAN